MSFLNIEFAPLRIPLRRRLQTLAVSYLLFTFFHITSVVSFFALLYLLFTSFYWITLIYAFYYYIDFDRCEKGGYNLSFLRKWPIWKHFRDYFPLTLVKTAELDPSQNYIFAVAPHGILSIGAIGNFGTEANDFSKLFPNLTVHLMTLKANFYWPLTREYNLLNGVAVASQRAFKWILSNRGVWTNRGQVCVVVPGGAEEALNTMHGDYVLMIKRRKGFCRLALITGTALVPVFTFGENDLFNIIHPENDSFLKRVQQQFKKWTNVGLPLAWGRGIFNYTFGFLPLRKPLATVVGKAIPVEKVENPTQQQIDELHERYLGDLVQLFADHKVNYPNEHCKNLIFK